MTPEQLKKGNELQNAIEPLKKILAMLADKKNENRKVEHIKIKYYAKMGSNQNEIYLDDTEVPSNILANIVSDAIERLSKELKELKTELHKL